MIKDSLEVSNYFSLHLALHSKLEKAPAEHLGEQISGSHLPAYVLAEMRTPDNMRAVDSIPDLDCNFRRVYI